MSAAEKIYLTESDYEVLDAIVERHSESSHVGFLEGELARAEILSEEAIPPNVVTLHSKARIWDDGASKERELTIVPPDELAIGDGKVSVLTPLGAAIVGLS